jgi:hypothetical protein
MMAAAAVARRAACQAPQQRACSHVCVPGTVPNGRTTASDLSGCRHHAHCPGDDGAGCSSNQRTIRL